MGLLGRCIPSVVLLASACYSPDLRDCTVSCTAEADCAPGHVCGSDRFCASPEIAGRCASLTTDDAGVPIRDAASIDADNVVPVDAPPPDAKPTTTIEVHVEGKGRITLEGIGMCDESGPDNGNCTFAAPTGEPLHLEAIAYPDWRFDRWTSLACIVDDETCTFTPLAPTTVTGKFRRDDD